MRTNCVHSVETGNPKTSRCGLGHGANGWVSEGLCRANGCGVRQPETPDPVPVRGVPVVLVEWEERGRAMWAELHARPAAYQGDRAAEMAWLETLAARVPCGACRRHWRELVAKMPPDLSSTEAYWRWTVDAHNAVNVRLGKPMWTPTDQPA